MAITRKIAAQVSCNNRLIAGAVFFLFFTFFSLHLNAQSTGIFFPEIVYDFGYVKESEGKVYYTFYFVNNGREQIDIKEIAASCGCMLPKASGKHLKPGEKGFIEVEYDPEGRPGKFIKSLEITVSSASIPEQKVYLNIKGIVIGREVLPAFNEDWKQTHLQIKPFVAGITSASDFRFLNHKELQFFINDITYEIDLNGFCTIELEVLIPEDRPLAEPAQQLFIPAKKFIISELRRRNYSQNHVGFLEKGPRVTTGIPAESIGMIRIASRDLNNDSISESGFYFKENDQRDYFRQLELQRRREDSIKAVRSGIRVYTQNQIGSIDTKSAQFRAFIEQVMKQALMHSVLVLSVRIESEAPEEKKEKHYTELQKKLLSLSRQFLSACEKEGIPKRKIVFGVPSLVVKEPVDPRKPRQSLLLHLFTRYQQEDHFDLTELLANDTTRKRFQNNPFTEGYAPPKQDLPSYQQFFRSPGALFDSSQVDFKLWMKVITEEMRSGKKIRLLIESSNSNAPITGKFDNRYLARKRAAEVNTILQTILQSRSLAGKAVFEEPVTMVQGPPFDTRIWGVSLYDKYQYIKIIPIYDSIPYSKGELFPYQVNFNYNFFELPHRSEIFQVFVSRIIPEIDTKGYIRLIVESCSSRVPADNYTSNETLSYYRAENTKYKLREEVRKRGYDPRRLIFVETRALVQGPVYKSGMDTKSRSFENFQYIKIIPEMLIKK